MIMMVRPEQVGLRREKTLARSARRQPVWRRLQRWKGRGLDRTDILAAAGRETGIGEAVGAGASSSADRRGDFGLMTYEAMRQEVLYHLEQLPRIEQTALIVTATVFSWMAVNHSGIESVGVSLFIWYVPLVFSLFSFYRHQMAQMAIRSIADFIATKVAPELDAVEVCWEEQMRRARIERKGGHIFRISNRIFWGGLIGSNIIVPIIFVTLRLTVPGAEL